MLTNEELNERVFITVGFIVTVCTFLTIAVAMAVDYTQGGITFTTFHG